MFNIINVLRPVWNFRQFTLAAIRSDLRGRFVGSRLGGLWFILQPLAQATIFALVLGAVLSAKMPNIDLDGAYAIYLLAGLAAWTLFTEILTRCLNVFIEFASVLKKIAFPRLSLPFVVWGSAFVSHVLLLGAIAVIIAFFGKFPSIHWLALVPIFILISMLAFGIGLLLAVFNVFSRDVSHTMGVVMQLWFWITPVVYPMAALPEDIQSLIAFNPMTPLVQSYQTVILLGEWPAFGTLIYPAVLAAVFVVLSFVVFQRGSAEIVDAL